MRTIKFRGFRAELDGKTHLGYGSKKLEIVRRYMQDVFGKQC